MINAYIKMCTEENLSAPLCLINASSLFQILHSSPLSQLYQSSYTLERKNTHTPVRLHPFGFFFLISLVHPSSVCNANRHKYFSIGCLYATFNVSFLLCRQLGKSLLMQGVDCVTIRHFIRLIDCG